MRAVLPRPLLARALTLLLLLGGREAVANGPAATGLPAPTDALGLLAVDRGGLLDPGDVALRLGLSYAAGPLQLPLPTAGSIVVEHEAMLRLGASIGILRWLQASVDVPISLASYSDAGRRHMTGPAQTTGWDLAAGDLRLSVKAGIVSLPVFRLALVATGVFPTGDAASYRSDRVFSGEPRLVAHLDTRWIEVVANVGARLHGTVEATMTTEVEGAAPSTTRVLAIGHELTWGAAVVGRPHRAVGLAVEAAGSESLTAPAFGAQQRTLALLGSLHAELTAGLIAHLGGGKSLSSGARRDDFRVFAGLAWRPGAKQRAVSTGDRDGDGIPDDKDACPDLPEDKDGFEDDDGCPDPDNDQDGVPDAKDRCRDVPEDRDGFQDEDGCPDLDNDGDGVPDDKDRCPDVPEPDDGFRDGDGCPNDDIDGDGIPNPRDACPYAPETRNGIDDEDGCPETITPGGGR